ncbi:HEAT repeat domain-containing protein [Terriglobus albidus]|uniref:HEAT repeat domain-containing protein n=1 Tax=Terriglobus albidus TaxID=1592106 RepID=UPI0021DF6512|nr:HEAT repeat domain-containing protein [Terriglobus albidus]
MTNIGKAALSLSIFFASIPGLAQSPSAAEDTAKAVLYQATASNDPRVRVKAVEATALIGGDEDVRTQIEHFLTDKNVDVRVAAVTTLAGHAFQASIPSLENVLKTDKVPEVQFAAAKALDALKDPEGRSWLIDVYAGTEKGKSGPLAERSRKFLANFHSFESAGTFLVTQGVGYAPIPGASEACSALLDLISDQDLSPRATALLLVGRDADQSIDQLLEQALKDGDWSVRATATQVIALTNRQNLQESLTPLLHDKNERVRLQAAGAYLRLITLSEWNSSFKAARSRQEVLKTGTEQSSRADTNKL